MGDHRQLFTNLIKDVEGHREDVYSDSKGNPTIGTGMNLNDPDIQGLLQVSNIDPEEVKSGRRKLASEELSDLHNKYMDKREQLIKSKFGPDLYETLKPNEKAAILSLGYQSLNNLGPKLTGYIANNDPLNAAKEMLLNTNKDRDPGILSRRLKEAEMYAGPLDFSSTFKIMTPEEKSSLKNIMENTSNENTRQELLKKYSPYIGDIQSQNFQRLFQPVLPKGK